MSAWDSIRWFSENMSVELTEGIHEMWFLGHGLGLSLGTRRFDVRPGGSPWLGNTYWTFFHLILDAKIIPSLNAWDYANMPCYTFLPRSSEDLFPRQYTESCAVILIVVKWCIVHFNNIYSIGSAVEQAFEVDKTCLHCLSILCCLLPSPLLVFFFLFLQRQGPSKLILAEEATVLELPVSSETSHHLKK